MNNYLLLDTILHLHPLILKYNYSSSFYDHSSVSFVKCIQLCNYYYNQYKNNARTPPPQKKTLTCTSAVDSHLQAPATVDLFSVPTALLFSRMSLSMKSYNYLFLV